MANKRLEEVGYRPFDPQPVLQQKILPLEMDNGDMLRRVASGLARVADVFFERGARDAAESNAKLGDMQAYQNAPGASDITGGEIQDGTTPTGLRVRVPPSNIRTAIEAAAKRNGEDPGILTSIAQIESEFDPNAQNPASSAGGLFQFTDRTARDYRLANRFDVTQSSEAAARLLSDNRRLLEGRLGRKVTGGELYLAHQQGAGGALKLLSNPDAKAVDVVGRDAVLQNGGDESMTAAQFAAKWTAKLDTATLRAENRRANSLGIITADGSNPDLKGVKPELISKFQDLQNAWGKQIPVKSGFRDEKRNRDAGGADHSQHLDGNALDLDVHDMPLEERKELIRTASALGFTGIGVYENSIHIDEGGRRAWGPNFHKESVPAWAADVIGEHMAEKATSERATKYQDTSADDGPIRVTPVRTPLVIKTNPGRWRPSGVNTIGGRSYDVAGTKTYLQMAKMAILEDQAVVFDKYKDDPVQLKAAMDQLLEAHRRDGSILPEIAPEYELTFRGNALGYLRQSQGLYEKRRDDQDTADLIGRIGSLEDRRAQMLAGIDPRDPQSATLLDDLQGTIDSHYDSAVSRGLLTPGDAELAKKSSRSDMKVAFYSKQVDGLDTAGIDALAEKMNADFSAGNMPGVTAEGWKKIQGNLIAARNMSLAQDKETKAQSKVEASRINKLMDDDVSSIENTGKGLGTDILDPASAEAIVGPQKIIEWYGKRQAASQKFAALSPMKKMDPDGLAEHLQSLEPVPGTPGFEDKQKTLEAAKKQAKDLLEARVKDPLGSAKAAGVIDLAPIDTSSPEALANALAQRASQSNEVSKLFQMDVPIFTAEEQKSLKAGIGSSDPAKYQGIMAQADFMANRSGVNAVETLLGKDMADAVQDWQAKVKYFTPEETKEWLRQKADPAYEERTKPLRTKGRSEAAKVPFEDVAAAFDGWVFDPASPPDNLTREALMNDFTSLMADRYAVTNDAGTAQEQAVQRIKQIWGVTTVLGDTGGRLMANPPEKYYPPVASSHDYLRTELEAVAKDRGLSLDSLSLVADVKTRQSINGKKLPGYLVAVAGPDGATEMLRDKSGRPLRMFFDVEGAVKKAAETASEERRTRNDPWLVLGPDLPIGPFYGFNYTPWDGVRGADPKDMEMTKRRTREIWEEQQKSKTDQWEMPASDIMGNPVGGN